MDDNEIDHQCRPIDFFLIFLVAIVHNCENVMGCVALLGTHLKAEHIGCTIAS